MEKNVIFTGKEKASGGITEKSRNPWKVELIGFVKSGKLYYETMDLPEKQWYNRHTYWLFYTTGGIYV